MKLNEDLMKSEKAMLELRALYQSFGYRRFRMSKFEEYALYLRNREFICADDIITFHENGKLMALKPDLTLSIIKNYRDTEGFVEKICYSETIYRTSGGEGACREILQTGLECMGEIDLYHICEVIALAVKSLSAISTQYVLELSHMGLVKAVLAPLEEELKQQLLVCIGQKNLHEIRKLCAFHHVCASVRQSVELLVSAYGEWKKVLPALKQAGFSGAAKAAVDELETVCSILEAEHLSGKINLDFSIANDMNYYSGILFKGFVRGIPDSILSGGQYDQLMERMGRKAGAIGFAVYLDSLDLLYDGRKAPEFDVVFLYDDTSDLRVLLRETAALSASGKTVTAQRRLPAEMTYRTLMKLEKAEVKILERND